MAKKKGSDHCIEIINKAIGDALTLAEKKQILREIQKKVKDERLLDSEGGIEQKIKKYIEDEETEALLANAIERKHTIINKEKELDLIRYLDEFDNLDPVGGGQQNSATAIRSILTGKQGITPGSRNSVGLSQQSLHRQYVGKLLSMLNKEGQDDGIDLVALFSSGSIEREIALELFEMRPGGQSGISKNPNAEKIARIIFEINDTLIDRANISGALIKKLPGYIMRQTHNSVAIRRAGFEAWKKDIEELLDFDTTFKDLNTNLDRDKFLKSIWDYFVSGRHMRTDTDLTQAIEGLLPKGSSLAKRLTKKHRIIHFKDADSALVYNDKYGHGPLHSNVLSGIESMARSIALLEKLGTNPENMLIKVIKRELAKVKRQRTEISNKLESAVDAKEKKKLDKVLDNLLAQEKKLDIWSGPGFLKPTDGDILTLSIFQAAWLDVIGATRHSASLAGTTAQVSRAVRVMQDLSKLGGATISAAGDIPAQVAELRYQGVHPLQRWLAPFETLVRVRGGKNSNRREIARQLGIGIDGMLGEVHSRFGDTDNVPGMLSSLSAFYFKLNLLSAWTDGHRVGMVNILSANLAKQAFNKKGVQTNWKDLPTETTRSLLLYNLGKEEWDNILTNSIITLDKKSFMVSDRVLSLPDEVMIRYLKAKNPQRKTISARQIKNARNQISERFNSYFQDRADYGVPQPGIYERSIMNLGTAPGTAAGEAMRHLMKFKSFLISITSKVHGREIYGYGARTRKEAFTAKSSLIGLAKYTVGFTLFGYISLALTDMTKGREPRVFKDLANLDNFLHNQKLLLNSMLKGGGMSFYGDILAGEWWKYRGFWESLLGPTAGNISDIMELFSRTIYGAKPGREESKSKAIKKGAANLVTQNTPGINLFYLQMLLNYFIVYNISEMIDPGTLTKKERRRKKELDQDLLISPSDIVPQGGGSPKEILDNLIEEIK
tara:strand:+ start:1884 stop:4730 length:2847 start_codon:yes stop_codon:yes gene_type:complete